MLVQEQWQNKTNESLIEAFINWLSPYLLVLDFLRDTQRETLELAAKNHALLVDQMFLLYPKVINQQAINAARVEARMRKSNQVKTRKNMLDTIEYIETQHSLI
jgi:hypothetical protein